MDIDLIDGERIVDIKGFEKRYAITDHGRVWSYPKNKSRNKNRNHNGRWMSQTGCRLYASVILYKNKKRYEKDVHRLVASAFCANKHPDTYKEVNHKDGDKRNNCYLNLEWCTHKQNVRHAIRTGLTTPIKPNNYFANDVAKKQVVQKHKDGSIIKIWACIADAERATKINNSNITACCKGRLKTTGGFIWSYDIQNIRGNKK